MNVHDSERVAGLLEDAGYVKASDGQTPDLVVFNTCAVRENAADRLYGNLGHLLPTKKAHKGMQIAVGGCLAQMERQKITDRAPWVDVVYGTHNIGALPKLLERARERQEAQVEFEETLTTFPSLLPARRQSAYSAWVSISVGCNNTCTFCIVPSLRGKEKDRRPGDILDEVKSLVDDGVIEVTLLGQNVNSYGAEFGDKLAFGKLLRACGEIDGPGAGPVHLAAPEGLHRRRDRGDARHAERDAEPAHAAAVRLGHGAEGDAPRLPPRPLPRDPRQRAQRTSRTRRSPRTSSSASPARPRMTSPGPWTWSARPGSPPRSPSSTRSARAPRPRPCRTRCRGRSCRSATTGSSRWSSRSRPRRTRSRTAPSSRSSSPRGRAARTPRRTACPGRARDNRLVHFAPHGHAAPRPGDIVTTRVTSAAPHYLRADDAPLSVRRTRAGDAWEARQLAAEPRQAPRRPAPAAPGAGAARHAARRG